MDPISNTLSSLNSLHAAYGAFSKAIHADHPALTLAKRLHVSASTYQRYLGSFLKRSDEVKRDAKLVAFLHEDRALIAEVVLLFETVTRRVGLINLLIPKLDILRNCERVMYERVEFFQLMPVNQDDVECIRAVIADAEGRLMWYRFVGCKNRVANVKQLVEGISSFMSETFGFPRLRHANYLLDAVCVKSEESEVTATEFGRALRRFGPMKDFYIKAAAVVGPDGTPMPWFKKDYSKNEAESCLGKGRNPCCALRYAIGHDFWLSIADNLGRVQHLLINNSSSGYTVADELIKGLTSYSTLEACVDACLRLPGIALSPEQRQLDWSHMEAWLAEIFESSTATDHPRYPAAFGMQTPKSDSLSPTRGQDFDEVSPVFPRSNAQKKFFALPPPPRKNSEKSEKSDHEVEEPSPKARGSAVAAMHVQNALQVLENSEGVSSTIVGMLKLCAAELGTKAEAEAEAAEAAEPAEANDA